MKFFPMAVLAICIFFCGEACAQSPEDPYAELWERIDGSTATIPLTEAILMNRLGISALEATGRIAHAKTYGAYAALFSGEKDLIFVPMPSQEELDAIVEEYTRRNRDPFEMPELSYKQVVKEGLVFIVNAENPVKDVTSDQLRGIYAGQIKNWNEVGGADAAIMPFQRNRDSGSQTAFLQLLMKNHPPQSPIASLTHSSMGDLLEVVAAYDNRESAIGYSMYFYVTQMYGRENLRLLAVDGILPSEETIGAGDYPFVMGYYAVYRSDLPPDHPAQQLVAWLLSAEGQAVVQQAGYVPLGVEP